jgi:hypothetical protein
VPRSRWTSRCHQLRPRPCKECPWRRDSQPGYLGPLDAETWLVAAHGDQPIACHETIKSSDQPWNELKQCRGSAIFRANVFKSPRNRDVAVGPLDTKMVFGTNEEFLEHHEAARIGLRMLPVWLLRQEAFSMPRVSRARKEEVIDWLLKNSHRTVRNLLRGTG